MAKYYTSTRDHPLIYQLQKNRLQKVDVCRVLKITTATYNNYIIDSANIPIKYLRLLSGMFGISIYELLYLIERCKPQLTYRYKADKWYLQSHLADIENKYKEQ